MGLTMGTGPFGPQAAGTFNIAYDSPGSVLYLEPSPRRVRVVVAGATVADSTDAMLLHETGRLPVYYLPRADVDAAALTASDTVTHCPFKGEASYWHVRVGEVVREDAVWAYPEPLPGAPDLSDLVAFRFAAADEWWEEAERIVKHPRDPYHRVDALASDRHVVVRLGGRTVADSTAPTMLFETGLPPRFYLPERDVDAALLTRTDTETTCPYKGTTGRYYDLTVGEHRAADAAWVYDEPNPEAAAIAGRIGFLQERLDLEVDGVPWARPDTPFA